MKKYCKISGLCWFLYFFSAVVFSQQLIENADEADSHRLLIDQDQNLMLKLQNNSSFVVINGISVRLNNQARVAAFYQNNQFSEIWFKDGELSELSSQLKEAVLRSREDALNPLKYHSAFLVDLEAADASQEDLEILMTDAYLTLADDLANGIVDPKITSPTWNAPRVEDKTLFEMLSQAAADKKITKSLADINAGNARYQALKLQYNAQIDENSPLSLKNTSYEDGLQIGAGLDVDTLIANMERQRWMPQKLGHSYIIVNIPAYQVDMFEGSEVIYHSASVVGSKYRMTPRFTDNLRYVVMSPTWTVPPTIMREDELPKLKRNAAQFDKNYRAISPSGAVMAPSSVDWNAVGDHYTLRQKPGRHNALGRVKFLFPNRYDIYLHDTPHKQLFAKEYRARSSGCVRLEKPEEFASLLLKQVGWTEEMVERGMNRSRQKWVKTADQIPIYLVYWTDNVNEKGLINQVSDVYALDNTLIKAYKTALN